MHAARSVVSHVSRCTISARAMSTSAASSAWTRLKVRPSDLRLEFTLINGQCFAWRPFPLEATFVDAAVARTARAPEPGPVKRQPRTKSVLASPGTGIGKKTAASADLVARAASNGGGIAFRGIFREWVLEVRQQAGEAPEFRCLNRPDLTGSADLYDALWRYFQLDVPLDALYKRWSGATGAHGRRMKVLSKKLPGMRILRQDPAECLLSFICSSNNNVSRIQLILDNVRRTFGKKLHSACVPLDDGSDEQLVDFFAFPSLDTLASVSEQQLRDIGLGYRAKFVVGTLEKLRENGGESWLKKFRDFEDRTAVQEALIELPGVGRKVADCVALFSLDQTACVPVDVHVWNIACRDFDRSLSQSKSLTPTVYARVGSLFEDAYGRHAGWAHSLFFAAELPTFRALLPQSLQSEMAEYTAEEKRKKIALKREKQAQKSGAAAKSGAREKPQRRKIKASDGPVRKARVEREHAPPTKKQKKAGQHRKRAGANPPVFEPRSRTVKAETLAPLSAVRPENKGPHATTKPPAARGTRSSLRILAKALCK